MKNFICQVSNFDDKLCERIFPSLEILEGITHNHRSKEVVNELLLVLSVEIPELSTFLAISTDLTAMDQDRYLILYSHFLLKDQIGRLNSYVQVTDIANSSNLSKKVHTLSDHLEFFTLAYYIILAKPNWQDFIEEFDGESWDEISTLQEVIPVARLSISEMSNWIVIVVTKQEKDGALVTTAERIKDWAWKFDNVEELENALPNFVSNRYLRRFLPPIIAGFFTDEQLTLNPEDGPFTEAELKTLEEVSNRFKGHTTKKIVDVSHMETAWQNNVDDHSRISFQYGFELKNF